MDYEQAISSLTPDLKRELYNRILEKYPWCTNKANIKRLAIIELKKDDKLL